MGRYYSGDIEGKFAFAVQPSTAPEVYLGANATSIRYCWSDKDALKGTIDQIKNRMKHRYDQIVQFFSEHDCYTDEKLAEYLHTTEEDVRSLLLDYYNYRLGEKAYKYMVENNTDYCEIDAEL